jgi:hypothetical protein
MSLNPPDGPAYPPRHARGGLAGLLEPPNTKGNRTMITVNAQAFARVALAQSSDPGRYYLNGVCIQPHAEGATMVATDGHMLLAAHDTDGVGPTDPAGVIVNLGKEGLKAAAKGKLLTIDPDTGQARVDGLWISPGTTIVDGAFPDWRRILPAGDLTATDACFDALLLARLGKALSATKAQFLTIRGADATGPHLVTGNVGAHLFGVCMPNRDAPGGTAVPAWATATA